MRIWDIDPGYLNRNSLLGEHRELHAVVSILKNGKTGYSRHPETLRWKGYEKALFFRHALLASEMELRGYRDRSPLIFEHGLPVWPDIFIDDPFGQAVIIKRKYAGKENGRILLPVNPQELWAQHKYSVMARDYNVYKELGPEVAGMRTEKEFSVLFGRLVSILRRPPEDSAVRNTLQHMWGYVKKFGTMTGRELNNTDHINMLRLIRYLAADNKVSYLMYSTALSELYVWVGNMIYAD